MLRRQPGRCKSLQEVLVHVAAEVRRIVGVDGGNQAGVEQFTEVVLSQIGEHAQLEIRQRAHRQRDAVLRQPRHQCRVFGALHAVVDALHFQHIERAPHISGRAFFAGVRDQVEVQFAAAREHAGELLGRVAHLAGVKADADELVPVRQRLFQRGEGFFLAQVAQEAQDQRGTDAELVLRIDAGTVQPVDHDLDVDTARRVRLRVEEHLGVDHVVGGSTLQVGPGHVVEILLFQQHAGAGVVDVQKGLQIGEGIGTAQRLDIGIGQRHAVALRQRKNQFGLQRTLDVHVQLGLGHGAQQFRETFGRNIEIGWFHCKCCSRSRKVKPTGIIVKDSFSTAGRPCGVSTPWMSKWPSRATMAIFISSKAR